MPAFSGLYDDVYSDGPYALHSNPVPPMAGLLRTLMQKRGLYGYAAAAGGTVPATRKLVTDAQPNLTVRGGWDYATRTNDAANQVVIQHAAQGGVRALVDEPTLAAVVPDAEATARVYDSRLNEAYAADDSGNGVGPQMDQAPAEVVGP